MEQSKTCIKCGQVKILSEFHKQPDTKDGFRGSCKACIAVYHRLRNQANPERYALRSKSYAKAHPEKGAARSRAYRKAHPEKIATRGSAYKLANADKIIAYHRGYRAANRELLNAASRAYYKANPQKVNHNVSAWHKANPEVGLKAGLKRRALKAGNGVFNVSDKELKRIRNSDCTHCGAVGPSHIDHVIPLSRGGAHSLGNLMPLCKSCNSSKGALFYMAFRMRATAQ